MCQKSISNLPYRYLLSITTRSNWISSRKLVEGRQALRHSIRSMSYQLGFEIVPSFSVADLASTDAFVFGSLEAALSTQRSRVLENCSSGSRSSLECSASCLSCRGSCSLASACAVAWLSLPFCWSTGHLASFSFDWGLTQMNWGADSGLRRRRRLKREDLNWRKLQRIDSDHLIQSFFASLKPYQLEFGHHSAL